MKKIGAIILAIMMIAMVGTAFAAGNTPTSDNDTNAPAITVTGASSVTVKIPKDIVMFNVDGSAVFEPNVTYTYSVTHTNVVNGTTVTGKTVAVEDPDTPVATVAVRSGVAGAVTIKGNVTGATAGATTTLVFGTDNTTQINTYKEGDTVDNTQTKLANKELDVIINASVIYNSTGKPGIYRYEIEDTTTAATLTAAGITRNDNYIEKLYLDVYTKNNSTNNGLEVYGYVLFKDKGDNGSQSFEYDSTIASETIKVSGFDVESETGASGTYNSGTGIISDQYHTYNVEVKKVVTGDMADKNNNFPFKVDLSNTVITSADDFYYVVTTDGTAASAVTTNLGTDGSWTLGALSSSSTLKFQNGDGILITGLPVSTKVMVSELNNTVDSYTASVTDTDNSGMTLDNDEITKVLGPSGTAAIKEAFEVKKSAAKDLITVTNNLESISPTGYVVRFAPYALILVAGIALLIIAKKHKKHTEEE